MNKKNFRTIYYKFRTLSEIQDISGQIIKNQEYQENQDRAHPCPHSGHPLVEGRAQDRVSLPTKDRRSANCATQLM